MTLVKQGFDVPMATRRPLTLNALGNQGLPALALGIGNEPAFESG